MEPQVASGRLVRSGSPGASRPVGRHISVGLDLGPVDTAGEQRWGKGAGSWVGGKAEFVGPLRCLWASSTGHLQAKESLQGGGGGRAARPAAHAGGGCGQDLPPGGHERRR